VEALANELRPVLAAPFDTRQFAPLSIGPRTDNAKSAPAVYVLTHIDVFPAGKDEIAGLVKGLAEARWIAPGTRQAHADADRTKTFRARLVPFEGALYDERLYKVIR
jgi:hypothetical protein